MSDPLLYALAVLTLMAAPGPTNTLLALAGASAGFVPASRLLLAETLGYLITTSIVGLLVAPAIAHVNWLSITLKVAVAAYLAGLAISLWRRGAPADGRRGADVGFSSVFVATLLNPKALVLGLGVVPWSAPGLPWYLAGLIVSIVATGGLWIAGGAVLKAATGSDPRLVPRAASVAIAGFAGMILASAFGG